MTEVSAAELLALFVKFASLAIFATGGALSLASDMHQYVVEEHGYITHANFIESIALARAAPGPNFLFVTVMGWQIAGLSGALATTFGLMVPAFVFPSIVARLGRRPGFSRFLDALQRGLGPVALGLMAATSVLLLRTTAVDLAGTVTVVATLAFVTFGRVQPFLLILAAGVAGAVLAGTGGS